MTPVLSEEEFTAVMLRAAHHPWFRVPEVHLVREDGLRVLKPRKGENG